MHGELVQEHVTGEPPGGLRIGGQADHPDAVRQLDGQLLVPGAMEILIAAKRREDVEGPAVLLRLENQLPALALELGVLSGGLLVPLAARIWPAVRRNRWSLFLPADAMVPVALGVVLFKLSALLQDLAWIVSPVQRPSEATESFLYLFILFYLIILARRMAELDAPGAAQ